MHHGGAKEQRESISWHLFAQERCPTLQAHSWKSVIVIQRQGQERAIPNDAVVEIFGLAEAGDETSGHERICRVASLFQPILGKLTIKLLFYSDYSLV